MYPFWIVAKTPLSHTQRQSNVGTCYTMEYLLLSKSRRKSHSDRPIQVTSYVQKIPLKHIGTAMAAQNVYLRLRTCHTCHPSKKLIVAWNMHSIRCGENSTDHFRTTNGEGINTAGVEKIKTRCSCWYKSHSWARQMSLYAERYGTPSHPWHHSADISVDNIRCCKYSQVLLMMGEDIARNM